MARELTVDEIMAILPDTPHRLAALTHGLTPAQLRAAPAPEAWSVNEILAHLRASHDVLGRQHAADRGRGQADLAAPEPAGVDEEDGLPPTWEFAPGFDVFRKQRADLLAVLDPLRPAARERMAIVIEGPGRTLDRSLRYYGDWMAGHEVVHLEQIAQIVTARGAEGAA